MLELNLPFEHSVVAPVPPSAVYELLDDIPDSLAHFPKLDRVRREGETWFWEMEKIGLGKFNVQVVYAVRYEKDPAAHSISWAPVDERGNAWATGRWTLSEQGAGTRMTLKNDLRVRFRGVPGVVRRVVEPLARRENRGLIQGYMDNLVQTLGGGEGRLRTRAQTEGASS